MIPAVVAIEHRCAKPRVPQPGTPGIGPGSTVGHDDIIWRVRFKDRWIYLYLLLEFQSTVDDWMPVRILTYLGLLYQDLINQGSIAAGEKLPPVLPIVLYNGKPRWHVATDINELIEPAPGNCENMPRT